MRLFYKLEASGLKLTPIGIIYYENNTSLCRYFLFLVMKIQGISFLIEDISLKKLQKINIVLALN